MIHLLPIFAKRFILTATVFREAVSEQIIVLLIQVDPKLGLAGSGVAAGEDATKKKKKDGKRYCVVEIVFFNVCEPLRGR